MKEGLISSALARLWEAYSSGLCECTPLLGLAPAEIMQYQAVSGLVSCTLGMKAQSRPGPKFQVFGTALSTLQCSQSAVRSHLAVTIELCLLGVGLEVTKGLRDQARAASMAVVVAFVVLEFSKY